MTKKVIAGSLALLAVTAMYAQTYQLPNVGFENWEKAKGILWTEKSQNQGQPGQEPQSWHSSNIKFATGWAGSYQELVQKKSDNGKTYANVINKKSGQASSYIPTLGTLTIGNTWYANYGDGNATGGYRATNEKFAQNGTYGGLSFVGRPDAIVGDFQNYSSDSHIIAYLWKGSFNGEVPATFDDGATGPFYNKKYNPTIKSWLKLENLDRAIWSQIDPSIVTSETVQNITKSDDAAIIAYVDKAYTANSSDWTTDVINLNYLSDAAPEMTNVIIAAGYPWDSRKSVKEESINVDNVRYAYFSRLSDASIDGYAFDFNPNTLDYIITVNDVENFTLPTGVNYSIMSNEALTADKEATVSSINDNKQISIKVTNKQSIANAEATDADGLREHTYNFYFREAPQQFNGFYFTNVNGSDIYTGEPTTFSITQLNNDYRLYELTFNDIKVAQAATRAAGDAVSVTVSGLTKTEEDGKVIYSGTDNAKVGEETKQVSVAATFDGDKYEVSLSFKNEDGSVTSVVATPEPATSGVSEINGATAAVAAAEGAILVSNYNGAAAVYTTDGRLAANAEVNGAASINVAAGLYIVRTGNKATKVIVK